MLSEKFSTPIYVECDKMQLSNVCVEEFSYYLSGLELGTWPTLAHMRWSGTWAEIIAIVEPGS